MNAYILTFCKKKISKMAKHTIIKNYNRLKGDGGAGARPTPLLTNEFITRERPGKGIRGVDSGPATNVSRACNS